MEPRPIARRSPAPDHPPYALMIAEAIESLDKTGTAESAIADYISSKYPGVSQWHEKLLRHYLAKHTNDGFFVPVGPGKYALSVDGSIEHDVQLTHSWDTSPEQNLTPHLRCGSTIEYKQNYGGDFMDFLADPPMGMLLEEPLNCTGGPNFRCGSSQMVNFEAESAFQDGNKNGEDKFALVKSDSICTSLNTLQAPDSHPGWWRSPQMVNSDAVMSSRHNEMQKFGDKSQVTSVEPCSEKFFPNSLECEDANMSSAESNALMRPEQKIYSADFQRTPSPPMGENKILKVFYRKRRLSVPKSCSPLVSKISSDSDPSGTPGIGSKSGAYDEDLTAASLFHGRSIHHKKKRSEVLHVVSSEFSPPRNTDSNRYKWPGASQNKLMLSSPSSIRTDHFSVHESASDETKLLPKKIPCRKYRRNDHVKSSPCGLSSSNPEAGSRRFSGNTLLASQHCNRNKLQRLSKSQSKSRKAANLKGEVGVRKLHGNLLLASLYGSRSRSQKTRSCPSKSGRAAAFPGRASSSNDLGDRTAVLALPARTNERIPLSVPKGSNQKSVALSCETRDAMLRYGEEYYYPCALALPAFTRVP